MRKDVTTIIYNYLNRISNGETSKVVTEDFLINSINEARTELAVVKGRLKRRKKRGWRQQLAMDRSRMKYQRGVRGGRIVSLDVIRSRKLMAARRLKGEKFVYRRYNKR